MRRFFLVSAISGLILFGASEILAQPFPITDVRALGMGGAFVAAGEGIGAVQQNPALLGKGGSLEVVIPEVVVRIDDHIGTADLIDDLNDLEPTDVEVIPILQKLEEEKGIDVQAGAAAGVGFGVAGISAGVTYARTIYGNARPARISIADTGNEDYNRLRYVAMDAGQIILSGAKSFGAAAFGANLRSIDATLYSKDQWLFEDPDTEIGDFSEGDKTEESTTAIDVGVFMNLLPMLDVGIVGRDINGPELGDVEFDPRYRLGAALNLPAVTIVGDLDINGSSIEGGTEYREWALGAEFDLWLVSLRAGLSKNTGLDGAPTLFHAGAGLGPLDIGAAMAEEGDYYMAGINLAVGF